jgi:hypothetical protein
MSGDTTRSLLSCLEDYWRMEEDGASFITDLLKTIRIEDNQKTWKIIFIFLNKNSMRRK